MNLSLLPASLLYSVLRFDRRATAASLLSLVVAMAGCSDVPEILTDPSAGFGDGDSLGGGAGNGDGDDGITDGVVNIPDKEPEPDNEPDFTCGDGELEPGELCDDGGTEDDDGCEGDCQSQDPDYDCSVPGEPCVNTVICGNGVLEGDEVCDEGTGNETDGCSLECDEVTEGWSCTRPGRACVLLPVCGNGTRERGEQCDDGQTVPEDGDGCTSICQQEPDYFCKTGEPCIPLECGDGVRTPNEACDDGDTDGLDGCSSACVVEAGWYCGSAGCKPICGDGLFVSAEAANPDACDDGDRVSGDGCSALCTKEPYFTCPVGTAGDCTSSIRCGDNRVDPGEVCDFDDTQIYAGPCVTPAEDPVNACKAFDTGIIPVKVCGNGKLEYQEECDGDNGAGCTAQCELEPGFACPTAGYCYRIPVCGDGLLQPGERCDVGSMSSIACTDSCTEVTPGWVCSGAGVNSCYEPQCNNGLVEPGEECDYGGNIAGCNNCTVITGYTCLPGDTCVADCGDGLVVSPEECDLDNAHCINCRLQAGWNCTSSTCSQSACENGITENGEGCDDGGTSGAGISGDGCSATCQLEPTVSGWPIPGDLTTCGDGIVSGSENCDDGNAVSGDGCSGSEPLDTALHCKQENGWACADDVSSYPPFIDFKVTYRDFKQRDVAGGHPHMKKSSVNTPNSGGSDLGIVGPVCAMSQANRVVQASEGASNEDVAPRDVRANCGKLNASGKPIYNASISHPHIETGWTPPMGYSHGDYFALWYADSAGSLPSPTSGNVELWKDPPTVPAGGVDTLRLIRVGATTSYEFSKDDWFPLGDNGQVQYPMRGFGQTETRGKNFQFTSELRYFFKYKPGATLTFFGDDDVWVFINGYLAVDVGGIHGKEYGRVVLGDDGGGSTTDSNCSVHGVVNAPPATCALEPGEDDGDDKRFDLVANGVYEVVIFQAERHPGGSNYKLTLDGFISPSSTCVDECGGDPGFTTGTEFCDDGDAGNQDGVYGVCNTSCTFNFCGDGTFDNPASWTGSTEECDLGNNNTTDYVANPVSQLTVPPGYCAPGCQTPGWCGDGILQPDKEVCDMGALNNGSYGGCAVDCQSLGGYCGDGVYQMAHEACDETVSERFYGEDGCDYECEPTPYCGDTVRNGDEICDKNDPTLLPGQCTASCSIANVCGDGIPSGSEECDYGIFAYDPGALGGSPPPYGGCTTSCTWGPRCGDDVKDDAEECDDGELNDDTTYGACTTLCTTGPHCGDSVTQLAQGEQCDNGFNEDTYDYAEGACAPGCEDVPNCGDGEVQTDFELCDNGDDNAADAYDGCTRSCEWGPYCGDGVLDPAFEVCDLGGDNAAYSSDGAGCGYDCQPTPYCGDGERNGPEQCDDGVDNNDGEYGGCNADCTQAPRCGDGVVDDDEACDDGPIGSFDCTPTCAVRGVVK